MDEFVKNAITGHSSTPIPNATPGHRYLRHGRIRQTSWPTIASASRQRPTKRIPAAKPQWTISARGCIVRLQIGEERLCDDQREQGADQRDEQRRLEHEPPEPLPPRMQDRQAVGLEDAQIRPPATVAGPIRETARARAADAARSAG